MNFAMRFLRKSKSVICYFYLPKSSLVGIALLLAVFIQFSVSNAFAQLPLPPFPDPFGIFGGSPEENQQVVNEMVNVGMERNQPGVPPYGLNASGDPRWPIPEPAPPREKQAAVNNTTPVPAKITDSALSGHESIENHRENTDNLTAKNKFDGNEISGMVRNDLFTGTKSQTEGTSAAELTENEIKALQLSFLYDLQRRTRFIYEAKNDMAAAVSSKWQQIGRLIPDKIDEISFEIASKNNFDKFSSWIDSVVENDKQHAENQ
ncbi:MAG: hypothetical protein ACQETH_14425 [Candidatus Rifleibacteriota bacterium]